jgi:hypothetical protein
MSSNPNRPARVTPTEAERFLVALANLEPGEAAARHFEQQFGALLPAWIRAFAAVQILPYGDRPPRDPDPKAARRIAVAAEALATRKYREHGVTAASIERQGDRSLMDSAIPTQDERRRATGPNFATTLSPEEQNTEHVWFLSQGLRRVWDQPDHRTKEWGAILLRHHAYAAAGDDALNHLSTLGVSGPLPLPTPFEQVLLHFVGMADRARHCENPDCLAPYFFAKRRSQKYCSERCALPAQREFKRRWWTDHGHERRRKDKKLLPPGRRKP